MIKASVVLKYSLVLISIFFAAVYFYVAFARAPYPFELEWAEGAMMDHCLRLIEGKQIYAAPSLEFVPFIYAPFYYFVGAAFVKLFGITLFSLRIISIISSILCATIIYKFVKKETDGKTYSLISVGLFFASFFASGAWFDIARNDSLFLLLILFSLYLLRFAKSWKAAAASGALMALAYFTKQTALSFAFFAAVYSLIFYKKERLFFILAAAAGTLSLILVMQIWSSSYYLYYTLTLPASHEIVLNRIPNFLLDKLLFAAPISILLTAAYSAATFVKIRRKVPAKSLDTEKASFYLLVLSAALFSGGAQYLKAGGWDNALIPTYAIFAIISGISLHSLTLKNATSPQKRFRGAAEFVLLASLAIQFAASIYNPSKLIPTERDERDGEKMIKTISLISGDVYVPNHGFIPASAGKRRYAHFLAVMDVLRSRGEDSNRDKLRDELVNDLSSMRFDAIILDEPLMFLKETPAYYRQSGFIFEDDNSFWPKTGYKTRPQYILTPR